VIRVSSLLGSDVRGTDWRKASYSMANGNCVEVISASTYIAVRDSINSGAIIISYPAPAWRAFIVEVKTGNFDSPNTLSQ
jgi:Domain of unknown function (DUF397)